jgi:hypothetical protein
LTIHRDDDNPLFCPIRHLLAWIYVSKIKGGYLFPDNSELERLLLPNNDDFVVRTPISYITFQKKFKAACYKLLSRDKSTFGSHTCQKTFYLFGIWQKAPIEILMRDARHATLKNAQTYAKDAHKLCAKCQRFILIPL